MPPCIRLRSIVAHLGVAHRSFALLFLCLALALISATPAISQDDAPADETPLDQRLTLEITSPKGELSLGDEALVTLVATSAGTTAVEAVSLHLHSAPGIIWSDDFKGPQLELGDMAAGESRVIEGRVRVDGLPASGSLGLFATLQGHGVEQAEARAQLVVPGLPPEGVSLAADGSLVESAGGRVRFTFPDSWNESDARLTFHLQEQFRQVAGDSGRLLLFTVEAAAADGNLVEAFDKPIEVTVNLSDLVDPEWSAANPPVVSTRRNDKENWTAVESTFDAKTGVLSFATIHFSEYQVTTEPQLWMLLYNPPGASPYNGAATYQYPIDLPPGIGGLAPDLTLSYSSRAADGMRRPAMSQGFGAGWALPQAQINNGNAGNFYTDDGDGTGNNKNYDPAAFALTLNGVNYYLNPLNTIGRYGTFKAIGAPELYIEYVEDNDATNDTDNVSGEFWRVRTPDGTTHTFGRSQGAEQVVWPMETQPFRNGGQHRNPKFAPYNWKLDSVVDVHGNRIEYVYETACGTKFDQPSVDRGEKIPVIGFQCSEVDTAVKKILYNFNGTTAQTKVMFTNAPVNGGPKKQEKTMTAGIFRPSSIEVRQGAAPNDALVRRYEFTYSSGAHYFSPWVVATEFWMLTSVTHKGSNGSTTLPVQTFTYNRDVIPGCADGVCVKLLTEVANGYGR